MAGGRPILTAKQQSYLNNRIEGMGPNDAYRESLYSSKNMSQAAINTEAMRLESNPTISLLLEEAKEKARDTSIMTRREALELLTVHARVKVTDVCDFSLVEKGKNEDGTPIMSMVWTMKDSQDIDPNIARCIKSVSFTKEGPKIEIYDTDGAIKQLRAMEGWDKKEHGERDTVKPTELLQAFNEAAEALEQPKTETK